MRFHHGSASDSRTLKHSGATGRERLVKVAVLAALSLAADSGQAQLQITVDTTQSGGVFNNGTGALRVSHPANDPTLTLTDGATTAGIGAVVVGHLSGESGQLMIEDGSAMTNLGTGTNLGALGGSASVSSGSGYLGLNTGSVGVATITGSGSSWTNQRELTVGRNGNGQLTVEQGGLASSQTGALGMTASGYGTAIVTGRDSLGNRSRWLNTGSLVVGDSGTGSLGIYDGALVVSSGEFPYAGTIASGLDSVGTVTVSGFESTWQNNGILVVGQHGAATLEIVDGGKVTDTYSAIAIGGLSQAAAIVQGRDQYGNASQWISSNELRVGAVGTGYLNVSDGGLVSSATGAVGVGRTGFEGGTLVHTWPKYGKVVVSDSGSVWNNSGTLRIGDYGTGQLVIQNGGLVANAAGLLGVTATATFQGSGSALVTGSGSTWQNSGNLVVGQAGQGELSIADQGLVKNNGGILGSVVGSSGTAAVSGAGSTWNNRATGNHDLVVGGFGTGTLSVTAGGLVQNHHGYLGQASNSSGSALVSGSGSTWQNSGQLQVGANGVGQLTVADGGVVSSGFDGRVGEGSNSTGTVEVTGSGSQWLINTGLTLGHHGVGELSVTSGGFVKNNSTAYLGNQSGAVGRAVVAGAGSKWESGSLFVGNGGQGQVSVHGAGTLHTSTAYLGFQATGIGEVTVTGQSSHWHNSDLLLGVVGQGTLHILDGGKVTTATQSYIAAYDAVGVGAVHVDGGIWMTTGNIDVGGTQNSVGGNGTISIANGGLVVSGQTLKLWEGGTLNLHGGGVMQVRDIQIDQGNINFLGGVLRLIDGQINEFADEVQFTGTQEFEVTVGKVAKYLDGINGSGKVAKKGYGVVKQEADSAFDDLEIDQGTWSVDATLVADVQVNSDGILAGNGVVQGEVVVNGGTIDPGESPGTLTSASAKINGMGGTYLWEINRLAELGGTAGSAIGWDLWHAGELTLDGLLQINLMSLGEDDLIGSLAGWDGQVEYQWLIATSTNQAFAQLHNLAIDPNSTFFTLNGVRRQQFSLAAGADNANHLYLHFSAVPEPGACSLMVIAGLVLCRSRWRRV